MSNSTKNSPLGLNVIGDYMYDTGFNINPVAQSYMGASKRNATYTFGSCISETCLRMLTWAINDGYSRGVVARIPAGTSTYDNLISIGNTTIPALGNSKPSTYVPVDPANLWARRDMQTSVLSYAEQYGLQNGDPLVLPGPATSGYGNYNGSYGDSLQGYGVTDQQQNATWYPYNMTNPNNSVTQWGWIRCHALQAWNEFNWNGTIVDPDNPSNPGYLQGYQMPEYKEFVTSLTTADSYISINNQPIISNNEGKTFLDGTYSNMNDLISADITGVSLATTSLGTDLENLGLAINLDKIDSFGLPSNLLITIGQLGGVIEDLALLLLSSGITTPDLSEIIEGQVTPSDDQERKIYGAFQLIAGENLRTILAVLQCKTPGLYTLADLLNVKKIFPNSFASLTVPRYNSERGPTNSKTYYLIYRNGSLNPALDTPSMKDYVGTLVPAGNPAAYPDSKSPNRYLEVPTGFDSYLNNILPKDQAIAAGALSFTMRQVSRLETFDIKQFAKVAKAIENVTDLPLTAGTSKPTDQTMINQAETRGALGSGPYGTYTMSDMFGCMSGLPYPWKLIKQRLNQLETTKLYNIYQQLFLAVTWEQATATVQSTESPAGVWTVTDITITNPGGGYGRENAPAPAVTINGTPVIAAIGTDDKNAGSVGAGTFGRITNISLPSGTFGSVPTITIEPPPGGGFPSMNTTIQGYIDQANIEIANILASKSEIANYLNTYWNILGTQLVIEQRARYKALTPVSVPKDFFASNYPGTAYNITDTLRDMSKDTRPHMSAQTVEAISNMNTTGGQSAVAAMRQERNQERLQLLGTEQDNNVPDTLPDVVLKQLTTNGTIPGTRTGLGIPGALPPDSQGNAIEYTLPAWPSNIMPNGVITAPSPNGIYVPNSTQDSSTTFGDSTVSPDIPPGFNPVTGTAPGDITPILENSFVPVVSSLVPSGTVLPLDPFGPAGNIPNAGIDPNSIVIPGATPTTGVLPVIIQPPPELDPSNLPPNLDPTYTGSTLMPSVPGIPEAIDLITECNCDCWEEE